MCFISGAEPGDLGSISDTVERVLASEVVLFFQSADVLTRPRCLLELYAAAVAGIPIVSVACAGKPTRFFLVALRQLAFYSRSNF